MTSDASGSGVSNVEWTTDDAASESAVWSSLTKDSSNTALWAGTVTPLVQGYNRIYVKITDRAGNSTSAELYPYVDTEVPAETVLVKVDDVAGADVDRKIVNGTADVVILLTAKDTGADSKATGIGSVSVSISVSVSNPFSVSASADTISSDSDTVSGSLADTDSAVFALAFGLPHPPSINPARSTAAI